jgi:dCTP deaminase
VSVLSDRDLSKAIANGDLVITPEPDKIQPCSVDLRLGPHMATFIRAGAPAYIIPWADNSHLMMDHDLTQLPEQQIGLEPGMFVLGHTIEHVSLPSGLTARVEGKSSLGRLGLAIHCTAGWIDPGFAGQITLELVNHSPHTIMLRMGMQIGQLVVERVTSNVERPYGHADLGSRYQGSTGAVGSRYHAGLTDAYPVLPFDGAQMMLPDLDSPFWNIASPVTPPPLSKPVGGRFKVQVSNGHAEVIDGLKAEIEKMQTQTADYRSAHERAIARWKDEETGRLAALKLADEKERALQEITAKYRSMERQNNAALASANRWEAAASTARNTLNEVEKIHTEELGKLRGEYQKIKVLLGQSEERLANVQIDRDTAQRKVAELTDRLEKTELKLDRKRANYKDLLKGYQALHKHMEDASLADRVAKED